MVSSTRRRRFLLSAAAIGTASVSGCRSLLDRRVQWRSELSSAYVQSPPTVRNDVLFATTGDGTIHAVSTADESTIASNPIQPAFYTGPTTVNGAVVVANRDVLSVELDGDVLGPVERVDVGDGLGPSNEVTGLAATDSTLLLGTERGHVYVIDPADSGSVRHVELDGRRSTVDVVASEEEYYVLTAGPDGESGTLFAFARGEERPRWRRSFEGPTDLALDGTHVYVSHANGVTAVDSPADEVSWTASTAAARSLAVGENRIYAVTAQPALVALERRTGRSAWGAPLDAPTPAGMAPGVGDGLIYVPQASAGQVRAVSTDGTVEWTVEPDVEAPPSTSPLVADGSVYVSFGGTLFALRP